METFYRYIGAIHVHTRFSDGNGTVEDVIAAARSAGLDFVIITDHNDLRAREYEGWYGNTLVLAGEEVTRPDGNHMLALGVNELIPPDLSPQEGIDAVKEQGGIAILAHPFYRGSPLIDDPPLPWLDWEVHGFDGIEVWNLTADLHQLLGQLNLKHPPKDVLDFAAPNPEALCKWDELIEKRKVIGVGGLDAHAEPIERWGGTIILPYEKAFRSLRLHLLLREPLGENLAAARDLVLGGLASGNFFISFDHLAAGEGILAEVLWGEEILLPGESAHLDGDFPVLRLEVARNSGVRVLYRGVELLRRETRSLSMPLEDPGPYRVEIYRENRLWVLINPFYITPRGGGD